MPDIDLQQVAPRTATRFQAFSRGVFHAIQAFRHIMRNSNIFARYADFTRTFGTFLVFLYGLLGAALFFLFPIAAFLFFWAPGMLWQLFSIIPLWAYTLTKMWAPMKNDQLFLEELRSLDYELANKLSQKVEKTYTTKHDFSETFRNSVKQWWHFTWMSLAFSACSIIPVIGSLASFLGQIWLVSDSLGWTLLGIYTNEYKNMNYEEQKKWQKDHMWIVLGFMMPYTLVCSIPLLGPLFTGLTQAAAAHLFYTIYQADTTKQHHKVM